LASSASAAVGRATLEWNVSSDSGAGSNGKLKLYLGRNCNINPINGRVCDYRYLQTVTGFVKGSGGRVDLTQDVDPDNDQLLMTFRDNDEVIFDAMKVNVQLGSSSRLIDLFKLDGMKDSKLAFDFDSRNHPCHSSYPRNTQCVFDNTFDFFTGKMKPHYSLLRGHVVKRIVEDIPVPAPRIDGSVRATSELILKTGGSLGDGSDDPLMVYYGKTCNANICDYTKVAQLVAKDRGTTYSVYLPDFDWLKDQLVIDYRSADRLNVASFSFKPCTNSGCGGTFDLTKFGTSSQFLPAWHYETVEEPCKDRSYSGYTCQYDAVYDFKKKVKYLDNSVFVGQ